LTVEVSTPTRAPCLPHQVPRYEEPWLRCVDPTGTTVSLKIFIGENDKIKITITIRLRYLGHIWGSFEEDILPNFFKIWGSILTRKGKFYHTNMVNNTCMNNDIPGGMSCFRVLAAYTVGSTMIPVPKYNKFINGILKTGLWIQPKRGTGISKSSKESIQQSRSRQCYPSGSRRFPRSLIEGQRVVKLL
jgi:hypothetical protein